MASSSYDKEVSFTSAGVNVFNTDLKKSSFYPEFDFDFSFPSDPLPENLEDQPDQDLHSKSSPHAVSHPSRQVSTSTTRPDSHAVSVSGDKFINFSRPAFAERSSPEQIIANKRATFEEPVESQLKSTVEPSNHDQSHQSRSARRVIRPDDWWQKNVPGKSAPTSKQDSKDPPVPVSLIIRSPSAKTTGSSFEHIETLAVRKSSASLSFPSAEPAQPPPPHQTSPDPEDLEEHIENPEVPVIRITREGVLKHILSDDDFQQYLRVAKGQKLEETWKEDTTNNETMMDFLRPESAAGMSEHRREAVRLAEAQEKAVVERCKRAGQDVPGYTFDELIGKGSYGRVYKGQQTSTNKVVAIKVLDVDEADFQAFGEQKDEQIRDFNREIRILRQAQESGAPNMNQIIEALPVHSQLWLICEYCPGGSVKTLMRATNDRLAERYIVVVGRELAKALKGLHDAGIMHRDVKAANVLIHEEGRLQLCDFGVAGVLEQSTDKRRTFIGTLHWMPPELWSDQPEYSDEVDVWEYGCTIYECALGKPPNSDLRERHMLKSRMRRLKQSISLPEHEEFSQGIRSLVNYTLSVDAKTRPSMKDVLEHEFLANTEESHPTSSLVELVQKYYQWVHSGGQRVSLFMPGGAVVSDAPSDSIPPSDEWNFSTTENFEKRSSVLFDHGNAPEISVQSPGEGDATPKGFKMPTSPKNPLIHEMTAVQKANFEARVNRGADLSYIFDQDKPTYEYKLKQDFIPMVEQQRRISDLPFRAMAEDRPTSIASNVIDLGDFDSSDYAVALPKKEDAIQLADAATIRAKRGDSKGPRDSSSTLDLTARRTSSADDLASNRRKPNHTPIQDFAFPPKEWATDDSDDSYVRDIGDITTPRRQSGRKTMDWTFATAEHAVSDESEEESPKIATIKDQQEKSMKHATMEWSFSSAMAEAQNASDPEATAPGPSTRTTPARRQQLLRTMTQPVTNDEVYEAEEIPRPATSLSQAFSESSMSSADFDPFSLDSSQEFPSGASESLDEMGMSMGLGMSELYATRGRTLLPDQTTMMQYAPIASNSVAATNAAATTVGTIQAHGAIPYILGQPSRIGEEGHPGPLPGTQPNLRRAEKVRKEKNKEKNKSTSSTATTNSTNSSGGVGGSGGGSGISGRPRVELPEAIPPSAAAMAGDASAETVEAELSRLLGGLQGSLAGAVRVLGGISTDRPPRASSSNGARRGRLGRPSSSEWEDEE